MIAWRSEEESRKAEEAWESLPEVERAEAKKASAKAMQILLARQRTEKELRRKLREKGYTAAAIDAAVSYVTAYGYLDDLHFAEVYLHSMESRKSRRLIRRELQEKGVREEWIEQVFSATSASEEETAFSLLQKKAGEPHPLEEKEVQRLARFLAGKGFSSAIIWSQIRRYRELAE